MPASGGASPVSVGSLRRARLLQRQLGGDDRERIERWIEVLDAVQDGVA